MKIHRCDQFNKEPNGQQPGRRYKWDFWAEREVGEEYRHKRDTRRSRTSKTFRREVTATSHVAAGR